MSWLCNCGVLNSGINTGCAAVQHYRNVEHYQTTKNSFDSLMMLVAGKEFNKPVTDNEELFSRFFSEETVLIASMTEAERIDHIQKLEEIAFEAKARLTAGKNYNRDAKAKRFNYDSSITPVEPNQLVSDTINRVALRTKRMTKLDKTRRDLENIGYDKKTIDTMISAMMKHAAQTADAKSTQIEAANKSDNQADDSESGTAVAKPVNKPKTPLSSSIIPDGELNTKPMDITSLKFGK